MSKNYIIPEKILQALLQYLASKPYAEVKDAIQVLTTLRVVSDKDLEEIFSRVINVEEEIEKETN